MATVERDLGMRGNDVEGLRGRLAQQGIRDVDIDLYGGYDDVKSGKNGIYIFMCIYTSIDRFLLAYLCLYV